MWLTNFDKSKGQYIKYIIFIVKDFTVFLHCTRLESDYVCMYVIGNVCILFHIIYIQAYSFQFSKICVHFFFCCQEASSIHCCLLNGIRQVEKRCMLPNLKCYIYIYMLFSQVLMANTQYFILYMMPNQIILYNILLILLANNK